MTEKIVLNLTPGEAKAINDEIERQFAAAGMEHCTDLIPVHEKLKNQGHKFVDAEIDTSRHQIECDECNNTVTGENERDAEVNYLLHYRRNHANTQAERTEINNQLAAKGYDP